MNKHVEAFSQVNLNQAYTMMSIAINANIVPLLKSSPGIGKSALAAKYAKEHNLKLIDLRLTQCDVTDLCGFPFMNHETGTAKYFPMETFPIATTAIPDGYAGWLLFLDELTSASQALQSAAYKLILDRCVGQHGLHPLVRIAAAGNLETDNAIVEPMSTALMSRMAHIYLRTDHSSWVDWASTTGNIDSRILAFLMWKPSFLYSFDAENTFDTYACPRTWEFASRVMQAGDVSTLEVKALLQGVLGKAVGMEFCSFLNIYTQLPDLKNIYLNPLGTPLIQDRADIQYALVTALAEHMDAVNGNATIKYIRRLGAEMQLLCIRTAIRGKSTAHQDSLRSLEEFKAWRDEIKHVMF